MSLTSPDRGTPNPMQELLDAVDRTPTVSTYTQAAREMARHVSGLTPVRVALLSSFTIDLLKPYLQVELARHRLGLQLYLAPFNTIHQELLDERSGCARYDANVVFIARQLVDVCPPLVHDFLTLSSEQVEQHISDLVTITVTLIESFRMRSTAAVVVHLFGLPQTPLLGIGEAGTDGSQTSAIREINARLACALREVPGTCVLDFERVAAAVGHRNCYDARLWHLGRAPLAAAALPELAKVQAGFVQAPSNRSLACRCRSRTRWKCAALGAYAPCWRRMASTAEGGVRIAGCTGQDVPAVLSFFARVYSNRHALCDPALLRWQFQQPPGGDGRTWHLMLAFNSGDVVGCLGYVPVDVNVGARAVRGAWVINWMVDGAHRHLGLGPLMMREVMRRFQVTLNSGPNQAARQLLSRMGWWNSGELSRHVAVLDHAAAASLSETGHLDWPDPALQAAGATTSTSSRTVTRGDRFGDDATELWERVTAAGTTGGTRRSAAFLNWRYAAHPLFQYRLFLEHQHGLLTGLAVYRIEGVRGLPMRVGRIVEYVGDPDEGRTGASPLLARVLADARGAGVAMMDYFCGDHRQDSHFTQHGFISDPSIASALPQLFQPIDRGRAGIWFMAYGANASDAAPVHWYVTRGDADQDRPS